MNVRHLPGVVIAGTHSGVGKTSLAVGVMAALRRRGRAVQPFKVGPDFIDPAHHAVASRRVSRNVDGWMLSREANLDVVAAAMDDADVCVVEGMMGLFDGVDGASEDGSTAQIAKWLGLPVVVVVDAYALSRSAGAVVKGYAEFDPGLEVAGVIYNRVGSPTHLQWLTDATASASRVPVLGGIPHDPQVVFPERHLGLHMPDPGCSRDWVEAMADLVDTHIDLDALLTIGGARPRAMPTSRPAPVSVSPRTRIGVARDDAFCFYYPDNLELLQRYGAQLVEFSPLHDRLPADLDGLYLGGGYPELLAAELTANRHAIEDIRTFAATGRPVYAECGGLMYLSRGIEDLAGARHELCGVLPFWTQLTSSPTLGYLQVQATPGTFFPAGAVARGHTFHYSRIHPDDEPRIPSAYLASRTSAATNANDGYAVHNIVASYTHLHWRSNPAFAHGFVDACAHHSRDPASLSNAP